MKKALKLITACLLILMMLSACGGKSHDAKLGLKALNEGNYDRARRLYTSAVEKGDADSEDRQILDILNTYNDAQRALKAEEFNQGLAIIDGCAYDYKSLYISSDMEKLYNQLSDGKYADERIRTRGEVAEAGNLERARSMISEINRLNLTAAQQERLETISKDVARRLNLSNPDDLIIYYVDRPKSDSIPMYSDVSEESEILHLIPGMEPIEVLNFADNGFISVIYNNDEGYVKSSDIVSTMPDYSDEGSSGEGNENGDGDNKVPDENNDNTDNNGGNKPVIEAISAGDTLHAIVGVNMRSGPSLDNEVLDVIPTDAEVTYLGVMENGFYQVRYNGKTGYAYSDYLQK